MMWDYYWIGLYTQTHCTARGLASQTIAAYRATLDQFRAYVEVRLDSRLPSAITARDVLEYLEYLRKERKNGDTAVNRQVTILKCFYRAMVALRHLEPAAKSVGALPEDQTRGAEAAGGAVAGGGRASADDAAEGQRCWGCATGQSWCCSTALESGRRSAPD